MEIDNLIEDVLSGDPDRRKNVISRIFEFTPSEPENITEILLKTGHLLRKNKESLNSRGEALAFLKELFDDCYPGEKLDDDSRWFITYQIVHAFVEEDCSIWEMKNALFVLNALSNEPLIEKLISNEVKTLQELGKKLPKIGDFEAQNHLLQFLCHIARRGKELLWSSLWFTDKDILRGFLKAVYANSPSECRKCLNNMNCREEYRKVFSFAAQTVFINSFQLKKPSKHNLHDFWIDLNFDSESLSFFCEKFTNTDVQTVCIQPQSVANYSLKADQMQELCITLKYPLSYFFEEDVPFLQTSNAIKIKFLKFLNVNVFLKKIFGLPSQEVDSYATTRTDNDRKILKSCKILSASFPANASEETVTRQRKISNSFDAIPYDSNANASEETVTRQRKISNSFDAIPYDSNAVLIETQRKISSGIIPISDKEDEEFYEPTPLNSNGNPRKITPCSSKTNSNTPHSKHLNGSAQLKHVTLEYTKPKAIQLPVSPAEGEKAGGNAEPVKLSRMNIILKNPQNRINKSELKNLSFVGCQSYKAYSEFPAEVLSSKKEFKKRPRDMGTSQNHSGGLEQNLNKEGRSLRCRKPNSKAVGVEDPVAVYSDEILSVILEEPVNQAEEEASFSPVLFQSSKETGLANSSSIAMNEQNGNVSQQKVLKPRRVNL